MDISKGALMGDIKGTRMPVSDKLMINEISSEHTLPDYQPEIRRILHIGATVMSPAKYVSGGGAEFNGAVDYAVLYVGADGELYSVPLAAEYGFSVPMEMDHNSIDYNEGICANADIAVENVSARLLGPRKISIRCKLHAYARAYGRVLFMENMTGQTSHTAIERLDAECNVCNFLHTMSDIIDMSTEIICDNPDIRVISVNGSVFVSDVSAAVDNVTVSGEIYLNLMTTNEVHNNPTCLKRKIPFSESVELEGLLSGDKCAAYGRISNIAVSVEEGRIICDASIVLDVSAEGEKSFNYTKDIYSTENLCECTYKEYTMPIPSFCMSGNFSMNERVLKEGLSIPEMAEIVTCYGEAFSEKCELVNGKGIISGHAKYTVILSNEGEYSALEILLPVKYEIDGTCKSLNNTSTLFSVISCEARQDAESLLIDAELSVYGWGMANENITVLTDVTFGESIGKRKGDVIIYYTTPSDTLWSVAKKYHISPERIEAKNGLNGSINGKDYLMI